MLFSKARDDFFSSSFYVAPISWPRLSMEAENLFVIELLTKSLCHLSEIDNDWKAIGALRYYVLRNFHQSHEVIYCLPRRVQSALVFSLLTPNFYVVSLILSTSEFGQQLITIYEGTDCCGALSITETIALNILVSHLLSFILSFNSHSLHTLGTFQRFT